MGLRDVLGALGFLVQTGRLVLNRAIWPWASSFTRSGDHLAVATGLGSPLIDLDKRVTTSIVTTALSELLPWDAGLPS